jgi:cytochrome c biogenesis factor
LFMALGGLVSATDRRYRVKLPATVRAPGGKMAGEGAR